MLSFIILLVTLTSSLAMRLPEKNLDDFLQLSEEQAKKASAALRNPELFEGDILGIDPSLERTAIVADYLGYNTRWPKGIIPYVIAPELEPIRSKIELAMNEYHKNTCVRFVPQTTEYNYLKIAKLIGCNSQMGMVGGGEQLLSLGNNCDYIGTILHELGHAVGFWHEHNRSDRDDYVDIIWDNVNPSEKIELKKREEWENTLITPFNYDSIMIYGPTAHSIDQRQDLITMKPTKEGAKLVEAFYKFKLTADDIKRVNIMYCL